ncbi:Crp/Fnr family transcriptional regulator [Solitalea koreensis]|uniref:CRP/FNR family transcriptional regulator, anaerobic regulatory protein n=1 Tax=Solitalea koreensis TaxID=543615 RepID=A0A521D2V3_9SPHI|nr:Crp/Fnr family transcriptional regulator [Solitalea koreensis]SMO66004.1 CRP/FNR family transcriptional regulator, anaerobic regulatory protein [Solitalea koreensis]
MIITIEEYLHKYFNQFEPALKKILAENCTIKTFEAGEELMNPGQFFKSTMLIMEGRVKLYREGEDSGEFFIYYLEPGDACALSMICATRNQTSQVMAKADEKTVVLAIPLPLMDQLMREYKTWYYFVLETYRSRFEELLKVIDHVVFRGMDERLEFYLKNQAEKNHTNQLKITHQEIANDLNSSREVISRLLKKMEQNNRLKLYRNYIEWIG